MSQDIDVSKTIENIEKYGEANPKELQETAAPAEEKPYLVFKTNDDFLNHQLEYKAADKPVKENLQTILQRAQQGYHYAQSMQKLKMEREGFETERKTIQQQIDEAKTINDKWSKFEQYAKENPEWYDHWNSAWENRQQAPGQQTAPDDVQARIDAVLAEKLKPFEGLLSEKQQLEQKAKIAEEDRLLDESIKSIRSQYKDIDFDRTDPETGKSLEYQVLEFMTQSGMTNFQHAFKAFYHDNLVKREIERQKEAEQKALIDKKKKGIVDEKTVPGSRKPVDTRNMSWDQLAQLAAKDLGIT